MLHTRKSDDVRRVVFGCGVCMCMMLAGCGGGGERTVSTTECATLASDVVLDVSGSGDLAATALSNDCDEFAIYADDSGTLMQLAILIDDEMAELVYDDSGNLVAIRTTDETASLSLNNAISAVRINIDGDNATSATLAVERPTGAERRRPTQIDSRESLCANLSDTTDITAAITTACEAVDAPAFCGGSIQRTAAAVRRLCADDQTTEQVSGITDRALGDSPMDIDLAVDGFTTTRAAAGGGTTFILSAVPFGGTSPASVNWSQVSGDTVTLQPLPGNVAVGDGGTNQGTFAFRATATDANGNTATDDVTVDLDASQTLVISTTNPSPGVGQTVTFTAVGTNLPEQVTYFWSFGDGISDTGKTVTHSYDSDGTYTVSLNVTATGRDLTDTTSIVVGAGSTALTGGESTGSGGSINSGDFFVDINIGATEFLAPGEQRPISADTSGTVGTVEFVWGILAGPGTVSDELDVTPAQDLGDFAFSANPILSADAEGIIIVGVLAFDGIGQLAEAQRAVPVFGSEGGLYAAILGPFTTAVGTSVTFDSFVVGGDTQNLEFTWRTVDDDTCLAGRSALVSGSRNQSATVSFQEPGCAIIELSVENPANGQQTFAFFTIEVFASTFGELSAQFLGPFDVPVNEPVELATFIGGAQGEVFCAWNILTFSTGAYLDDPFSCKPVFVSPLGGCTEMELYAQDVAGNFGFAEFEICASTDGNTCAVDGVCDNSCLGFDPDCGDNPCPFDGLCNLECPILDPDCLGLFFCVADDFICDEGFCPEGQTDPDCAQCSVGNVCIDYCTPPDPDCGLAGCPYDFFCDPSCPGYDPDCETFEGDCAFDGICNADCYYEDYLNADPDCSNADICADSGGVQNEGFCCTPDDFCDEGCPTFDPECDGSDTTGGCTANGACNPECAEPFDPDCSSSAICEFSGFCCDGDEFCDQDFGCPEPDADCAFCGAGDFCVELCSPADPDCNI